MSFSKKAQKCWIPGLVSQVVYLFPIAAVINCHKPGDLTQVYWYYLIALDIRSLKSVSLGFSQMSRGLVPSGSFRREYVSLLFSAFPGCLHSLPPGPSSHHFNFLFPWSQPLLLTLTLLLPSYMDTWDYTEPNWKIQDSLSISKSFITSSKSLLPYKVTFTGSGG